MKIGILSDTRLASSDEPLPDRVLEAFAGVDLVVHAGNITRPFVLERLEEIAPVKAVLGPLDDPRDFQGGLPLQERVELEGHVMIVRNDRNAIELAPGEQQVDIAVHGNTCIPRIEEGREFRLSLNPGSPTRPARFKNGTVILLKIKDSLLFSYIIKV